MRGSLGYGGEILLCCMSCWHAPTKCWLANPREWAAQMVQQDPEYFKRLQDQQAPEYLWIGCADSRVPVSICQVHCMALVLAMSAFPAGIASPGTLWYPYQLHGMS